MGAMPGAWEQSLAPAVPAAQEMDEVNPQMETYDVCLVIGALVLGGRGGGVAASAPSMASVPCSAGHAGLAELAS